MTIYNKQTTWALMGVGAVKEKVQPDDQERGVRQKRMRNCLNLAPV